MSEWIAIVVAMQREIDPLLRLWRAQGRTVERVGIQPEIVTFQCGNTFVHCAGIGRAKAAEAARYAVAHEHPSLLVSAGLAGATTISSNVGDVVRPSTIVDAGSRKSFDVRDSRGTGVLVTTGSVVSRDEKLGLQAQYQAVAVDMEAAAVAEVAAASGVRFVAVKAISDPLDFPMPPLDRFISPEGTLNLLHLMGWAVLRPSTWRALVSLHRNSRKAAEELARELERVLAECNNVD